MADTGTTDLAPRTALVTGSGGGMGRAIAAGLADMGCAIVLNDVSAELMDETEEAIAEKATQVLTVVADVTDATAVTRMVHQAERRFGGVDILVNNAGLLRPTRFADIEEAEWDLVIDVNLKGAYLCTRAVIGGMGTRGWGRVVNLSSTAGKNVSTMGGAHYTSAKAGLLGLTRAVAFEVASAGVTVNAICPGLFDTEMTRRTITNEQADQYAQSFPIPRLGRPDEVADLVQFIASERASYITGAAFDINGGDLMV